MATPTLHLREFTLYGGPLDGATVGGVETNRDGEFYAYYAGETRIGWHLVAKKAAERVATYRADVSGRAIFLRSARMKPESKP